MYPVSTDFHNKMRADKRRTTARAIIDYTDPFSDQSVTPSANEQANISCIAQTADSVETSGKKWASLDGGTMPDGTWWPAPGDPSRGQVGWWGTQLSERTALEFDGTGSYIDLGSSTIFNNLLAGAGLIKIRFGITPAAVSGDYNVIFNIVAVGIVVAINNGQMRITARSQSGETLRQAIGGVIAIGNYYDVRADIDFVGGQIRIYINDEAAPVVSENISWSSSVYNPGGFSQDYTWIGNHKTANRNYSGVIHYLNIKADGDLVFDMPLDEGDGDVAHDLSGNNNHGIIHGATWAGIPGAFTSPYPTLSIAHLPRPARTLKVVGDDSRGEYPVDFDINLYAEDNTLLKTVSITGNNAVSWTQPLDPWVLDVAKQELVVKKWSHVGRQAKILEFFTSIQETYLSGDLVSIRLLEEREASQGSLPVGNVSANEIVLGFNNEDGKFDLDNEMSPLANLLKANRRIRAWLGAEVELPEVVEDDDLSAGELHQTTTDNGDLTLAQHQVEGTEPTSLTYVDDFATGEHDGVEVGAGGMGLLRRQGLLFTSGTDNYAELSNPIIPSSYTGDFTLEFEVDKTHLLQQNRVDFGQGFGFYYMQFLGIGENNRLLFMCYKGAGSTNVWPEYNIPQVLFLNLIKDKKTVVFTIKAEYKKAVTFYLNGVKLHENEDEYHWNGRDHRLGYYSEGRDLFLSGCKVYLQALSEEEIEYSSQSRNNTVSNLALHYKVDEGAGNVLTDLSGNNNHATISEAEWVDKHETPAHRLSPPLSFSTLGKATDSEISWQATTPAGTSVTIETALSTDGGTTYGAWQPCTNGGAIPGMVGKDLSNALLKLRQTLETTDTSVTPLLKSLTLSIQGEKTVYYLVYFDEGHRISDPIDLAAFGLVNYGAISWDADLPAGTTLQIDTALSTDNGQTYGAWQPCINGQLIPGIDGEIDLSTARLKIRAQLATADTDITPKLFAPIRLEFYPVDNPNKTEELVPLGTFWSLDWDSPDDTLTATVTARDRMEILRKNQYETSPLWVSENLYDIAAFVLQDAGLYPGEWVIDDSLKDIVIPYAWFDPMSHRDALRRIAEAGLATVYADRDGRIRIESFAMGDTSSELTITEDDYFLPLSAPSRQEGVANEIIVLTQPLEPVAAPEQVYRSSDPVAIPASTTQIVTVYYTATPVMDATASLVNAPAGVSIVVGDTVYYAWGADVAIRNTTGSEQQITVKVDGKPLKPGPKERVVARDAASILENGTLQFEFPDNPFVQRLSQARAIAEALVASFKDPRRDVEVNWRGNPALLLGDQITVKGRDYHVIRQELEWTGALSARLTARRVKK